MDCAYPRVSRRTLQLDNGVRVALHHQPEARRVAVAASVAAGSADEPTAWPGLAHFLEHALFLGSAGHPEVGAFADYVHGHGGRYNARTLGAQTLYYLELPAAELAGGLARLVDLLANPLLDAQRLCAEREVIDAEYRARCADPDCQLHAALAGQLAPEHPLARFQAGNRSSLNADDPALHAALRDWHARHYRGSSLRLLLDGPQSLDELERLARELAAGLPGGSASPVRPAEVLWPAGQGAVELTLAQPQALQRMGLWLPLTPPPACREALLALLRQAAGQPADGGLLASLRARGWAQQVDIDWLDGGGASGLLGLRLELLEGGLGHEQQIAASCLAWLQALGRRPALAVEADEWSALCAEQAWQEYELAPMERAGLWLERWGRQGGEWHPWGTAEEPADLLAALDDLEGTLLILQVTRADLEEGAETPWFPVAHRIRALDGLPLPPGVDWQAPPANPFLHCASDSPVIEAGSALLRPGHAALLLLWTTEACADTAGAELAGTALEACWQQHLPAATRLGHAWQALPSSGWLCGCLSGPAASLPEVTEVLLAGLQRGELALWRASLQQRRSAEQRQMLLRRLLAHPAAQWRLADEQFASASLETLDDAELNRRLVDYLAGAMRWAHPFGTVSAPAGFALAAQAPSGGLRWQGGEHCQYLALGGGERAVLLRLLAPSLDPGLEAAWRLLAVLSQNAFYQSLRVEQGLGYALFSRFLVGGEGCELQFGVQSPHADDLRLQRAVREFVWATEQALTGLDSSRLEQARRAASEGLEAGNRRARLLQAGSDWLAGRSAIHRQAVAAALEGIGLAELQRAAALLPAAEWRWLISR